jgi:hypothetical protein
MKRPEVHVVEAGQRLSRSLIWRLQRRFYAQRGIAAFSQGTVPHYITSNPFIAKAYARVVLGYLRDLAPRLRPGQPVYLIELGAGTGRFGFHFVKSLSALLAQSPLQGIRFCYVLTDFSPGSVAAWQVHPALQPLVAAHQLDFAVFDAAAPDALALQGSGAVLSPGALENPLIVLANYVLDGIPQDAFRLQDGQLYESLVTLTSFQPEPDLDAPGLLDRLDVLYEARPVHGDYYDDPACNRLLSTYARGPEEGVLLFPCAALACLAYLRRLSGDRLLLLTGDKGDPTAEARLPQSAPELVHHGSVSLMVNHHALGEYVRQAGGQVFTTTHRHAHLNVSAFVLDAHPAEHAETRHAYGDAVQTFGPDDWFLVTKILAGHLDGLALDQILALLRLGGSDHNLLAGCYAALLRCLPQASEPWQNEARQALAAVWQSYYHIGEKWDLPFHLGTLLVAMRCHREAAQYFCSSLTLYGPTVKTLDSLARCHDSLGEAEAAQRCRAQAQQLTT